MGSHTYNTIQYAADYFLFGKAEREFVHSDRERYNSTQQERDTETGFDYRGVTFFTHSVHYR
jgi:hypothetical protein